MPAPSAPEGAAEAAAGASAAPPQPAEGPKRLPPTRIPLQGPYQGDADEFAQSRESLGLVPQKDGTYFYVDPYKRFTASFHPDGTVAFADRWRRPDRRDAQHGKCCGLPRGLFGPMGMSVTGPTEWAMALAGEDRDARAKAELLKSTREMRTAMAISWTLDLLARRLGELDQELIELWSRRGESASARRERLFRRWDECDERFQLGLGEVPQEALGALDAARVDTAERARRTIERFIREKLPAGSASAYTPAELRAMNARRSSHQPFEPYKRSR